MTQRTQEDAEKARQRCIRSMEEAIDRCIIGPQIIEQLTEAQMKKKYGDGSMDEEDQMSTGITIDPSLKARMREAIDAQWLRDATSGLRDALANDGADWRANWLRLRAWPAKS